MADWQWFCFGGCCILPPALIFWAIQLLRGDLAVEQWAREREYKILDKRNSSLPIKYRLWDHSVYYKSLLMTIEDKDGLRHTVHIIANGDRILEAIWDD